MPAARLQLSIESWAPRRRKPTPALLDDLQLEEAPSPACPNTRRINGMTKVWNGSLPHLLTTLRTELGGRVTKDDKSGSDGAEPTTPTAQQRHGAEGGDVAPETPRSASRITKRVTAFAARAMQAVAEWSLTGQYVMGGEWSVDPHASDEEARTQRSASVGLARDLIKDVSEYLQVDLGAERRDRLIRWVLAGHITPQQAADALVRGLGASPDLAELLALASSGTANPDRNDA